MVYNERIDETAGRLIEEESRKEYLPMKIGRNQPCPCGSGKKYKKCCKDKTQEARMDAGSRTSGFEREMAIKVAEHSRKERLREEEFGKVRPIIHVDHQGHKFVAVGDQLHYSNEKEWVTFPDFLLSYIKTVLDADWGQAELTKPLEERHQILKWYDEACRFQSVQEKNEDGLFSSIPSGPFSAYLLLAYDLYVLRDHMALQAEVVRRLKNKDQFQGARYELFVAATCCRAGFHIDFEDETDRSKKHPEFIATHRETGQRISVEAKSRHRAGVLDFKGGRLSEGRIKVGVERLLRKALQKPTEWPYVIFVDINLPPLPTNIFETEWFKEIVGTVDRVRSDPEEVIDQFNLLIFTNHPHHYGDNTEPDPQKHAFCVIPKHPKIPEANSEAILAIYDSALKYGNVPNDFPED